MLILELLAAFVAGILTLKAAQRLKAGKDKTPRLNGAPLPDPYSPAWSIAEFAMCDGGFRGFCGAHSRFKLGGISVCGRCGLIYVGSDGKAGYAGSYRDLLISGMAQAEEMKKLEMIK